MDKCVFCGKPTSFKYEGDGEYHQKPVCPACQATKFKTNFNSGCANDDCSIKLNRP